MPVLCPAVSGGAKPSVPYQRMDGGTGQKGWMEGRNKGKGWIDGWTKVTFLSHGEAVYGGVNDLLSSLLSFCKYNYKLTNKTRGRLGTNEYLRKRTQRIIMAEI